MYACRCKELEQSQCSIAALQGVGVQAVVTEFLIRNADILFSDTAQNGNMDTGWSADEFVVNFLSRCKICYSVPALLAMQIISHGNSVLLFVLPSHAGTLSRRMKIGSCGLHCEVAKTL